MQPPQQRKYRSYFTRAEIAQMFEVAPNTVNRWVRGGRLPSVVTPGGRRRYPVDAILRMIPEPDPQVRIALNVPGAGARRPGRRKAGVDAGTRSRGRGA